MTDPHSPAADQARPPGEEAPVSAARVLRALTAIVLSLSLAWPLLQLAPLAALPFARADMARRHAWFQMDNEEGALLFQTLELRAGRQIYRPLTDYPYTAGTYPPLFMLANAPFADAANPSFLSGRILVAACTAGAALLIVTLILIRSWNLLAAALGALLFLASYEVFNWIAYYRVDLPALFFSVAGVAFASSVPPRDRVGRVLSIAMFALAFYTKQTAVAGPIAVTIYYLSRNWRSGLLYASGLVVALGLPFAALSAITWGQFAVHTVRYNMNTYHVNDLGVWGRHVLLFYPWLILSAVAAIVAWAAARPPRPVREADPGRHHATPIVLYAILSLFNFLAIGKAGSAENYLLEPLAAFSLLIADTLARLIRQVALGIRPLVSVAGAMTIAALVSLHAERVSYFQPIMFSPDKGPDRSDFMAAEQVLREVQGAGGRTWCELAMLNLLAGRPIEFQPFIMGELARQRLWDPGKFEQDLANTEFALIVTNRDIASDDAAIIYTSETLSLLRGKYRESARYTDGRTWKYFLYRPPKTAPLGWEVVLREDGASHEQADRAVVLGGDSGAGKPGRATGQRTDAAGL